MKPNQAILNRGYMTQNEVLEPHSMRPYVNERGLPVVSVPVGVRKVVQNGKQVEEIVFAEREVRLNALLRKYDWEQIDAELLDVHRQPLIGIDDLRADGLVRSLDGIGVSISTYEQLSDMSPASVSMSVTPRKGEDDRVAFEPVSIPVPVISKPFTLDLRTLSASQRNGHEGLDVTQARVATIKVREALEDMLFNGSSINVDGAAIYGYVNAPQRDTDTAAGYGGGDFGTDGNGHKTLAGMIEAMAAKGFNGPWRSYVANTQYAQLLALTGANKTETQLSVIQRTIPELKSVRRAPRLADGTVALVQMSRDVVDLAIGLDITPVSWQEYGGMVNDFRILCAMVPRVKYDANGNAGVAVATFA
jgi:uncharacterized linocin/CFP29 family protein